MSYRQPALGAYTRKSDGTEVVVLGSTGGEWNDNVLLTRTTDDGKKHTWHVRLENFWKKFDAKDED
jgi:hypothetical protein